MSSQCKKNMWRDFTIDRDIHIQKKQYMYYTYVYIFIYAMKMGKCVSCVLLLISNRTVAAVHHLTSYLNQLVILIDFRLCFQTVICA